MRRRHVFGRRGVGAAPGAVRVNGHALVAAENLHRGGSDAQFHQGSHEPMRHAVVVAIEFDVIVDVDAGALEARDRHARGRQRAQGLLIQRGEGTCAAAGQLLERPGVQVGEQLGNGSVEFGQAEEAPVAKARQDPPLDHLDSDFDLRLVARTSGARWKDRHVVVVAELIDQAVDGGLVAIGPRDQGTVDRERSGEERPHRTPTRR